MHVAARWIRRILLAVDDTPDGDMGALARLAIACGEALAAAFDAAAIAGQGNSMRTPWSTRVISWARTSEANTSDWSSSASTAMITRQRRFSSA